MKYSVGDYAGSVKGAGLLYEGARQIDLRSSAHVYKNLCKSHVYLIYMCIAPYVNLPCSLSEAAQLFSLTLHSHQRRILFSYQPII